MDDKKKNNWRKSLEERDREDQELFGWKGGVTTYYKRLDLDSYIDDSEEREE